MAESRTWKESMNENVCTFFGRLLKLPPPWQVTEVTENAAREMVMIRVEWPKRVAAICPVCQRAFPVYDHLPERTWRHEGVMQYTTDLRCAVPRCNCPDHGVKTMGVPWAEPGSHFTLLFERSAIAALTACHTVKAAEEWLKLDWDSCQRIMERAVERGLAPRELDKLRYVGLDEKSFLRGQRYISVMTDVGGRRVLEVARGNDEQSGRELWQSLPEEQRGKVEAAAMDMWDAFVAATRVEAPQCAIVHDKFHVSKQLNDAVDQTRRAESTRLDDQGDPTLKGTRYLWLKGEVPDHQQPTFSELLERNLKTAKAWYYKELFVEFWGQDDLAAGKSFFEAWYRRAIHTRLGKIKKVARTLKEHLPNLLTYFLHRITNAVTEGFNSRIQAIKSAARGFRSFENYRIRILFFCGKLDLMPRCPV